MSSPPLRRGQTDSIDLNELLEKIEDDNAGPPPITSHIDNFYMNPKQYVVAKDDDPSIEAKLEYIRRDDEDSDSESDSYYSREDVTPIIASAEVVREDVTPIIASAEVVNFETNDDWSANDNTNDKVEANIASYSADANEDITSDAHQDLSYVLQACTDKNEKIRILFCMSTGLAKYPTTDSPRLSNLGKSKHSELSIQKCTPRKAFTKMPSFFVHLRNCFTNTWSVMPLFTHN